MAGSALVLTSHLRRIPSLKMASSSDCPDVVQSRQLQRPGRVPVRDRAAGHVGTWPGLVCALRPPRLCVRVEAVTAALRPVSGPSGLFS